MHVSSLTSRGIGFGNNNDDGVGDVSGRDIAISATSTPHKISFSDRALRHTIEESVCNGAKDETG